MSHAENKKKRAVPEEPDFTLPPDPELRSGAPLPETPCVPDAPQGQDPITNPRSHPANE